MRLYIIRNSTLEYLFEGDCTYSMYNAYNPLILNDVDFDAVICFLLPPVSGSYNEKVAAMEANLSTLSLVISESSKQIVLLTMVQLTEAYCELSDNRLNELIGKYNEICYKASDKDNNIACFNLADFLFRYPRETAVDWKHYYLSHAVLNPRCANDFKTWFKARLDALSGKRKKCLILDLDNTLWGGIIGEDGINGISIGGMYPGNVYEDVQRRILTAYENGVILAICSKNNEPEAVQALENHPNMVLREHNFAAKRINWDNKADNIKDIANALNIGLDSIVFIDDNPFERDIVRTILPEVEVPDFPEKLYMLPACIENILLKYFSLYHLTPEDRNKTLQYQQNELRISLQNSSASYEDYLRSLGMSLQISFAQQIDIPRIAQLTQKTNQFNLTTKRYTEEDIRLMINNRDLVFVARVKDKFGEYGLTGLCIIKTTSEYEVEIDTLLLSCRVIGREVENEFLFQILLFLADHKVKVITAKYSKTLKNTLAESFYDKLGFSQTEKNETDKHYICLTNKLVAKAEMYVKVIWNNE